MGALLGDRPMNGKVIFPIKDNGFSESMYLLGVSGFPPHGEEKKSNLQSKERERKKIRTAVTKLRLDITQTVSLNVILKTNNRKEN